MYSSKHIHRLDSDNILRRDRWIWTVHCALNSIGLPTMIVCSTHDESMATSTHRTFAMFVFDRSTKETFLVRRFDWFRLVWLDSTCSTHDNLNVSFACLFSTRRSRVTYSSIVRCRSMSNLVATVEEIRVQHYERCLPLVTTTTKVKKTWTSTTRFHRTRSTLMITDWLRALLSRGRWTAVGMNMRERRWSPWRIPVTNTIICRLGNNLRRRLNIAIDVVVSKQIKQRPNMDGLAFVTIETKKNEIVTRSDDDCRLSNE
jgi:hypothetical protein